jgi:hypothetical protein
MELLSFHWCVDGHDFFGIVVNFTSAHNNANWSLVSVYGPCQGVERDNFVSWLYNMKFVVRKTSC